MLLDQISQQKDQNSQQKEQINELKHKNTRCGGVASKEGDSVVHELGSGEDLHHKDKGTGVVKAALKATNTAKNLSRKVKAKKSGGGAMHVIAAAQDKLFEREGRKGVEW